MRRHVVSIAAVKVPGVEARRHRLGRRRAAPAVSDGLLERRAADGLPLAQPGERIVVVDLGRQAPVRDRRARRAVDRAAAATARRWARRAAGAHQATTWACARVMRDVGQPAVVAGGLLAADAFDRAVVGALLAADVQAAGRRRRGTGSGRGSCTLRLKANGR